MFILIMILCLPEELLFFVGPKKTNEKRKDEKTKKTPE